MIGLEPDIVHFPILEPVMGASALLEVVGPGIENFLRALLWAVP
jgi:hypothetical protein